MSFKKRVYPMSGEENLDYSFKRFSLFDPATHFLYHFYSHTRISKLFLS